MLINAKDKFVANFADRLHKRKLYKCVDVRERLVNDLKILPNLPDDEREARIKTLDRMIIQIRENISRQIPSKPDEPPRILLDQGKREFYTRDSETDGPLNQILIRNGQDTHDMADLSDIVRFAQKFEFFRIYHDDTMDDESKDMIESVIVDVARRGNHA